MTRKIAPNSTIEEALFYDCLTGKIVTAEEGTSGYKVTYDKEKLGITPETPEFQELNQTLSEMKQQDWFGVDIEKTRQSILDEIKNLSKKTNLSERDTEDLIKQAESYLDDAESEGYLKELDTNDFSGMMELSKQFDKEHFMKVAFEYFEENYESFQDDLHRNIKTIPLDPKNEAFDYGTSVPITDGSLPFKNEGIEIFDYSGANDLSYLGDVKPENMPEEYQVSTVSSNEELIGYFIQPGNAEAGFMISTDALDLNKVNQEIINQLQLSQDSEINSDYKPSAPGMAPDITL